MRLAIALFVASLSTSFAVGADDAPFPFTVFVAHDRTQIRSGPGDDHYATDELPRGDALEVHERAEGGWLGIRPHAGSFSWVSQRELKTDADEKIGEVVGSAAVSWIGSNANDISEHRWLVKLDRGERLEILGKERRQLHASGKSELFYKVAPPAGEFRWIHEDDVTRDQKGATTIRDPNVELADFRVALRGSPRPVPRDAKPETTSSTTPSDAGSRDSFSARGREVTDRAHVESVASIPKKDFSPRSTLSNDATKKSISTPLPIDGDFESALRELESKLSLVASRPVEEWNFGVLRDQAQQLSARGPSTLERARAQLFLDKLAEFEGLRSRHALVAPKPAVPEKRGLLSTLTKSAAAPVEAAQPQFDGRGLLYPVHSTKRGAPPYALLDSDGNILQFVSPSPGMNLSRFVKKEVGIFGQKDSQAVLDKPHLTAARIVELNHARR